MNEDCLHLFVYGSLRSGFNNTAYKYISDYFDLVANVSAKGILFEKDQIPVAIPTDTDATIVGELYKVKNQDEFSWAIAQLDDYEGVNPDEDEICYYRRDKTDIQLGEKMISAWVYWYCGDTTGLPTIPNGDVLAYFNQKKTID